MESDHDEDAEFIAVRHPDGVQSTLTLQKTISRGLSPADERCPHPEMAARRASETAGSVAVAAEGKDSGAVTVRACSSDVAVNGDPRQHQIMSPPSRSTANL